MFQIVGSAVYYRVSDGNSEMVDFGQKSALSISMKVVNFGVRRPTRSLWQRVREMIPVIV
jgi:hypothetical protein